MKNLHYRCTFDGHGGGGCGSPRAPGPEVICSSQPDDAGSQIRFSVPDPETVQLSIRDLEGRLVQTLVDVTFSGGNHTILRTGRDASGRTVPRGVHWLHLAAGAQTKGFKVLVIE